MLLVALALIIGWLALPVTALLGDSLGDAILPVALLATVLLGLIVGGLLPDAAGAGSSRLRGGALGAGLFLVVSLVSTVILWVLISG